MGSREVVCGGGYALRLNRRSVKISSTLCYAKRDTLSTSSQPNP